MQYPKEVLTKNNEARVLEEKGQYVKYAYIDQETGKPVKEGKYSLILKSENSKRHLFIIPTKQRKSLVVKDEEEKGEKAILEKNGRIIKF